MRIIMDEDAYRYLSKELNLTQGDGVRFFVKYGGESTLQPGFSLGIAKDVPRDLAVKEAFHGIDFFIEENDKWYFDEHNLHVSYRQDKDEIEYRYEDVI